MNILYIAHRIPYPPDKGDKIRAYHTLRFLAARHAVWCACFVDDPADFVHVATLRRWCRDVIALPVRRIKASLRALLNLAVDESASDGFYRDPEMSRALARLNQRVRIDAVVAFSSTMAQYALGVDARRRLVDLCDLDSRKWAECARRRGGPRAWMMAAEARHLGRLERLVIGRFDAAVLISAEEAADLSATHRARIHVVGNGVDIPPAGSCPRVDQPTVGFVGDMSYWPNEDAVRWFADTVWHHVRRSVSGATFHVIGRHPSRAVRRLADRPGINVVGSVPDVRTHLCRCRAVVAPLRIARGVQNKVLEAMAAARPVVATAAAVTGIDAVDGQHLLIADDSAATAERLVRLLTDDALADRISRNARGLVERCYDWSRRLEPWQQLLASPADSSVGSTHHEDAVAHPMTS